MDLAMRPVPPRSAAEIRDSPWKRDPSLIHAPLIHVCDRLTSGRANLHEPGQASREDDMSGEGRGLPRRRRDTRLSLIHI
eukprot:4479593-Pyramimonas_sp.AAC.1